jgi:peptidoglycan LD-endopeptidase LytH
MAPPIAAALGGGIVIGWLLHAWGPPAPALDRERTMLPPPVAAPHPVAPTLTPDTPAHRMPSAAVPPRIVTSSTNDDTGGDAVARLRARRLRSPIDGVDFEKLKGAFTERRSGNGGHVHEAVDILAPRHTPIKAVEDGTIARLFDSKAGGHTIYQFDPTKRFAYYYAHLERYADGLRDGQTVSAGDVIGFVGTSGNAPANTPHLHFTVFELDDDRRWWEGRAIDPYLVFR